MFAETALHVPSKTKDDKVDAAVVLVLWFVGVITMFLLVESLGALFVIIISCLMVLLVLQLLLSHKRNVELHNGHVHTKRS